MKAKFTLEYWLDEDWYVGRLKEFPGVFSQGETLKELEVNIIDAYRLIMEEMKSDIMPMPKTSLKQIRVDL